MTTIVPAATNPTNAVTRMATVMATVGIVVVCVVNVVLVGTGDVVVLAPSATAAATNTNGEFQYTVCSFVVHEPLLST